MERNLITRAAEFISEQRKKKRWTKVVTAMAAVVVFCTTYALILPAITQETDVFCGHEAHSHGADCYGQVLTCDLPEAKAHVHSDDCYEVERTLVCTQEESAGHTHTDACRTAETHLTCTSQEEGHEHGEGCYTVTSSVTCGQEESTGHSHGESCWEETRTLVCTESTELPEGGHVHGPDCYGGEELTCTKKEHEHELKCYSNPKADLESASVWERTLPDQLTGIWADDLLAVAETQLGYQESSRNYDVDNENNKLGYTRYGDWYGSPYGHWCAMFVSFCLNYADIPTQAFPWEASCQQWINDLYAEDLYRPAGDYTPKPGDLIFFNWDDEPDADHVGIVKEVTLDESGAVTQIKTIEGNTSNQVKIKTYLPTDESVMGYGELPENPDPPAESEEEGAEETEEPEETDEPETPDQTPEEPEEQEPDNGFISLDSLLEQVLQEDVSNGPVVRIFALSKEEAPATFSVWDMRTRNVMMLTGEDDVETEEKPPQNLLEYLKTEKVNGSYNFTLVDTNNVEVPKEEGKYVVTAGTAYKLTLSISAPEGIKYGTYQYQLPEGLTIHGGEGEFILKDGTNVGSWSVSDDGLMTFVFNEKINNRTGVVISATMGAVFGESPKEIAFDGNIYVTVQPPIGEDESTGVNKWAEKTDDLSKIHWVIQLLGKSDSKIVGSTITDTLFSGTGDHYYAESDRAGGLHFTVGEPNGDSKHIWHEWSVSADDPNLVWEGNTWSYVIPEIVFCDQCNKELSLGDAGWEYYIRYTSTPTQTNVSGTLTYGNTIMFDRQLGDFWGNMTYNESFADINKTGVFQGDANGGNFVWNISAKIPGKDTVQKTLRWSIYDNLGIKGEGAKIPNDIANAKITATNNGQTYNGQTYNVPVTVPVPGEPWTFDSDCPFVILKYSGNDELILLSKCKCTSEENCLAWSPNAGAEKCGTHSWNKGYTHCECWNVQGETVFNIVYKTSAPNIVNQYGGLGKVLQNSAQLYYREPGEAKPQIKADDDVAEVTIPGIFTKELTQDFDGGRNFDGYIAKYKITVNEGKLDLGNTSVTIRDEMTTTLAYISGSLVITATDKDGNVSELEEGDDYTISYDGTGNQKDSSGKPIHLLTIEIHQPKSVMYTLNYDATLVIPEDIGPDSVKYQNAAYVTLWGGSYSDTTHEKTFASINISAERYEVKIQKKDNTGKPLAGAEFGLFNQYDRKITSDKTDSKGELLFGTDVINGIILGTHEPYYIREIDAPDGYITDGTKHWFYFCNSTATCEDCNSIPSNLNAQCVHKGTDGNYVAVFGNLVNYPGTYELPETGGAGASGYTFGGLLLMAGAGFLLYRKTRDGREAKTSS